MTPATLWSVAALAIVSQTVVRYTFGQRHPIGDEVEYLARAARRDPFSPEPFLRVPALVLLGMLAGRRHTEARLRDLMAIVAVLTVVCVAVTADLVLGPMGAVLAVAIFTLWPDRVVLSQHIWPDTLMALWHALATALLAYSLNVSPVSPWLLGAVAAAAAMTRLDGLTLAAALTVVSLMIPEQRIDLWPVWLVPLVSLGAWTLHNAWRYGLWVPDNTLFFNVAILAEEQRSASPTPVETLVARVAQAWPSTESARVERTVSLAWAMTRQPVQWSRGTIRRVWQMLGPDAFAIDRLLNPYEGAYPDLTPAVRATLSKTLALAFPLFTGLAIAGASTHRSLLVYMIPGVAQFVAASVVNARTRFRYAVLPALSVAAAGGIMAIREPSSRTQSLLVAAVAGGLLLLAPARRER